MDWPGRPYLLFPNGYLHFIRLSTIWPLQGATYGPTRRSLTVKYLWIMTASCLITCTIPWLPCEQLPNLPEYPRISRIRRRDKSFYPCPFCPINSSFSGTPSPSHHSTTPTLLSKWRRYSRSPRSPTKSLLHNSEALDHPPRGKMAINFIVPEVSFSFLLLYFFSHPCSSAIHFTEYFPFLSLFFPFTFKTIRICPTKLLSPPINHTSSALAR